MDLAFILLAAAEAAEEEHKSEAPFFIIGGVFVAFALAISVLGFKKPDFPNTNGAGRAVMGLGLVLMVATGWSIIYISG